MIKTIYAILMTSALFFAVSCEDSSKDTDYVSPPHVTTPEDEQLDVKPTYSKDKGVLRLVSYNVGAFSKYTYSVEMIAKLMLELDADIIGMNEVDSCTTRTGREYQLKKTAQKMGNWNYYYGRAMAYQGGAYGNGIIASPDLKETGRELLAIPKGTGSEPRSCVVMKTDKFIYMVTHLEVKTEVDRLRGVHQITEWAKKNYGNTDMPVFLCGDMNCEPQDAPIIGFLENWTQLSVSSYTYPSRTPKKCIDFIFALNNGAKYEFVKSQVPTEFQTGKVTDASDHLPVYVDVKLK